MVRPQMTVPTPSSSTRTESPIPSKRLASIPSKHVDWRNYDYSEGPPKAKGTAKGTATAEVSTRDVNPYSKREEFTASRTTLSNAAYYSSNTGSLSHQDLRRNHSHLGAVRSHTEGSSSSFNTSAYLSARSFDDGLLNLDYSSRSSSRSLTGFASPPTGDEDESAFGSSTLTYRPAKTATTPPTDIEDDDDFYDEEEEMRIPKVKKYAENLDSPAAKNKDSHTLPFDHQSVTYDNDHVEEQERIEKKRFPQLETPDLMKEGGRQTSGFEDVWEEPATEEEEEVPYENEINKNDNHDNMSFRGGRIQFDDFAGDRSKASSVNDRYSDTSVSRMEIPMNVAPVSILKHSGRFDASAASSHHSQVKHTEHTISAADDDDDDGDVNKKIQEEIPNAKGNEDDHGDEDDDTLFEFSLQTQRKSKRKPRSRNGHNNDLSEEDDTSIDETGSPKKRADSLKDRTKQAWSARNKATAAAAKSNVSQKKEKVSFHNDATVREFDPESDHSADEDEASEDESDDETEYTEKTDLSYDDSTYAGRSMHSVYTKSYESEAEDFIKDIFLVGRGEATNPGRRQLRYKHGRKEIYRNMYKEEDDDTVDYAVDESFQQQSAKDSSYSLGMLYNLCDDGLQTISDVLGFSKSDLHDNDDSAIDSQLNLTTADEWYTYASRVAFYADKIEDNQNGLCGTTSTKKTDQPSNVEALLNMSLNTARMRHSSRKLKYDETQTLNVITDVKVVRLLVGIPVGISFDENDIGCVVEKIFENGNAVNSSRGDKIKLCDHLASIDGKSVYRKSVTDICNILAACTNSEEIQLVFLRYVGPIRNSIADEQQGYEVIDPKIGKESSSPLKLSKSLSNVGATRGSSKPKEALETHGAEDSNVTKLVAEDKVEESKSPTKKKRFGFFRIRKGNKTKESK